MDKFQQFYTHIQKHPFSLVKHLIGLSIKKMSYHKIFRCN